MRGNLACRALAYTGIAVLLAGCGATSAGASGGGSGGNASGGNASGGQAADFNGGSGNIDAGSSGGSPGSKRLALAGSSWDARFTLTGTPTPAIGTITNCGEFSLSLHIDQSATDPSLLLGSDGRAQRVALRKTGDGYAIAAATPLPVRDTCLGQDDLQLSTLSLHGVDADNDGAADTLSGSAIGLGYTGWDVRRPYDFTLSLTGTVDVTPPVVLPPPSALLPLDRLFANVSEPLLPEATLSLEGTSEVAFTPVVQDELDVLTNFSSEQVLPFGGTWTTRATARDFAGHALTAPTEFQTVADPGLFAEDGFEGELAAAPTTAVQVVDGIGALPAISGQRSLWVTSKTVVLHLKRAPGQTKLRARAQWFYQTNEPSYFNPVLVVGVTGTSTRSSAESERQPPSLVTGDPVFAHATQVIDLTLALEGDGTDVVVAIQGASLACYHPICPKPGGLLLDDLRLE